MDDCAGAVDLSKEMTPPSAYGLDEQRPKITENLVARGRLVERTCASSKSSPDPSRCPAMTASTGMLTELEKTMARMAKVVDNQSRLLADLKSRGLLDRRLSYGPRNRPHVLWSKRQWTRSQSLGLYPMACGWWRQGRHDVWRDRRYWFAIVGKKVDTYDLHRPFFNS